MQSSKTQGRLPRDQVNLSVVDPAKVNQYYLPGDINAELEEAFKYYDKEDLGWITMPHF